MKLSPRFMERQKTRAKLLVHHEYPSQLMFFSAWKVRPAWFFRVVSPTLDGVDKNVLRHLEEAFKMMINHTAKSVDAKRAVGGGSSGVIVVDEPEHKEVRVYLRTDKYRIILDRDLLGAVSISVPSMTFTNDIPGMNQAKTVCGQVVSLADMMEREISEP